MSILFCRINTSRKRMVNVGDNSQWMERERKRPGPKLGIQRLSLRVDKRRLCEFSEIVFNDYSPLLCF